MVQKSFADYRERLRTAVARRDSTALLELLAPDIMIDLGGGSGRAAFAASWQLEDGRRSRIWRELETLLRLGCAKSDGNGMVMPFFFNHLPEGTDVTEQVVVIDADIPLRAEPRNDAPVLTRLSWRIVDLMGFFDTEAAWVKVAASGQSGFVARDAVRGILDHRALYVAIDGRWTMQALVAGD